MKKLSIITSILLTLSITSPAIAQVKDQSFKDWTVYTTTIQGKKTCYTLSFPKSKTGNYSRRDEPYFIVTRIDDNTLEVSTSSGYPYKNGSDVTLEIGDNKYLLFTKGEDAWAKTEKDDTKIIEAMKKGYTMSVKGTSQKGTYSIDNYSLSGITASIDRMNSKCK